MALDRELYDHLRAYVAGESALVDLREWLEDHVQEVADSRDARLRDLDSLAWLLIAEFDRGHRDEAEIRQTLRVELDATVRAAAS